VGNRIIFSWQIIKTIKIPFQFCDSVQVQIILIIKKSMFARKKAQDQENRKPSASPEIEQQSISQ